MRNMTLADRIREIMQAKDWNQSELARKAKVGRATVSLWLDGTVKSMKGANGVSLHRTSGFSLQWILTGEGIKKGDRPFTLVHGAKGQPEIDLNLLRDSITGVESYLKDERIMAPPDKKASLIALVYEHSMSAGRVDDGAVRRILRLVS